MVVTDFRDELASRRAEHDALAADQFFDKTKGLLVQTLATAVRQRVTLGKLHNRRDTDDADTFWQHSTVTSR